MLNRSKLVSVIVPIYNVQPYLAACLTSLVDQDYPAIEVVAVDDGSTDGSQVIVEEFQRSHRNIVSLQVQHQGQSGARNAGLKVATGELIVFLDSDDYLNDDAISTCVRWLDSMDCDVVFFSARPFSDGLDPRLPDRYNYERRAELLNRRMSGEVFFCRSIALKNFVPSACLYVYRRSCMEDLKFYDGIVHEDNLFNAQLLLKSRANVVCIPDRLLNRRLRPGSIMTEPKDAKHVSGYITVAEELAKLVARAETTERARAVSQLVQDTLVATMTTSRMTYGNRFPWWLRRRAVRLLSSLRLQLLSPRCVAVCVIPELLVARALMDNLLG